MTMKNSLRSIAVLTTLLVLLWAGFLFGRILVWNYPQSFPHDELLVPLKGGLWVPANQVESMPLPLKSFRVEELPAPPAPPAPTVEQGREILRFRQTKFVEEIAAGVPLVSVDGWDITVAEADMVRFTNEYRVRNGRRALKVSGRLMGTVRTQAWLQIRRGMSHGYTSGWGGENIASGQQSARAVVTTWINSPGHRANMLGNYEWIGVGGYSNQWTQQFR